MTKLVNKITVAGICGELEPPKKPLNIMRIVGRATEVFSGTTTLGEYFGFLGEFEATNISTGEITSSNKLLIPDIIANALRAQFGMEGVEQVEFAYDLGIFPAKTPTGYQYSATPLIESEESPLKRLSDSLPPLKALAKK